MLSLLYPTREMIALKAPGSIRRYDESFINMTLAERSRFLDFSYRQVTPQVEHHQGVTVTRSGVCIRGGRIIPASIHWHRRIHHKLLVTTFASLARRKRVRLVEGKPYIIIHNMWTGGYYHWIAEALPRLIAAKDHLADGILLLPQSKSLERVMLESAAVFGATAIQRFPGNANVMVPDLVLPRNSPLINNYQPNEMEELRERAAWAAKDHPAPLGARRLFISRSRSRGRKIANEEEVQARLIELGFSVVHLEDFGFLDQVRLFQQADEVVAQHGAGLVNIAFMRPGTRVIELIRRQGTRRSDWNRLHQSSLLQAAYPKLAACMNVYYECLLCEAVDVGQTFDIGDVFVDVEQLVAKLGAVRTFGGGRFCG